MGARNHKRFCVLKRRQLHLTIKNNAAAVAILRCFNIPVMRLIRMQMSVCNHFQHLLPVLFKCLLISG